MQLSGQSSCSAHTKPEFDLLALNKLGMVVHACDSALWDQMSEVILGSHTDYRFVHLIQLGSYGRREPHLRKWLHQIDLWSSLWENFLDSQWMREGPVH